MHSHIWCTTNISESKLKFFIKILPIYKNYPVNNNQMFEKQESLDMKKSWE